MNNGSTLSIFRKAYSPFLGFSFYIKLLIIGVDNMGKLVHRHGEFIVIEDDYRPGEHIIINTKGKYENHGHIKHLGTCKKLLKLMNRKIVPHSDYLRETVLRISLDKGYIKKVKHKMEKDKQKPKFVRVQKGVIRK